MANCRNGRLPSARARRCWLQRPDFMNNERLNLLPDPQLVVLKPQVGRWMERGARSITSTNFDSFFDVAMRRVFTGALARCDASEGSLWLLDRIGENLVNVFNTGPDASTLAGFRQPLKAGIIGMVFVTRQHFMESDVCRNAMQDKTVDRLLGKQTQAMMAVPLCFAHECRGVVTAVRFVPAAGGPVDSSGFAGEHLAELQSATDLLGRLIDLRLLSWMIGWGKD